MVQRFAGPQQVIIGALLDNFNAGGMACHVDGCQVLSTQFNSGLNYNIMFVSRKLLTMWNMSLAPKSITL